jgi:hypothetical protein
MTTDHYLDSKPTTEIDDKRLQKLKRIQAGELSNLANLMGGMKVAGYQEGILDALLDEVRILREDEC